MLDNITKTFEQAAAFQKLWTDSIAGMTGAFSQFSPGSSPVEETRKLRANMLKTMTETWEEFTRTPQFMEMIKTSFNGMFDLKGASREGMEKLHEQLGIPSKDDLDGVLLSIRHVERRLLDRMDAVDERLAEISERIEELQALSKPRDRSSEKRPIAAKRSRAAVPEPKRRNVTARQRMTTAKAATTKPRKG